MHIKEIEIDGFKSYAQKQVIGKFDDQFNAITGLNGSGKSNILDSICFVLGITNLTHIRAQSNNDLIFKQGNAGITKAFVKITFDNTGARRFSNYGEVVTITRTISISSGTTKGTNNYTICGSNASCTAVADLFRSVGLNVNNPHFLIMQGRITKVLNMKPVEILGMIEEAAGTKMYDQKRNQAISNMEKKDQKIEDIRMLMEQEILPTVQRMKDDREEYLKYQKYERDLALLKRKHSAFIFDRAIKSMHASEAEAAEKVKEMEDAKKWIAEVEVEIENIKGRQKEEEKEKTGVLQKKKDDMEAVIARKREHWLQLDAKAEALIAETSEASMLKVRAEGSIQAETKNLAKCKAELAQTEGELGGEEERGSEMENEIKAAKAKLLALEQGMTTNDAGEMVTLESQITDARTLLTEITTDAKTRDARVKELERKKGEKERELARYEKEDKEFTEYRGRSEKEMNALKAEMEKMKFNEEEYLGWKAERDRLGKELKELDAKQQQIDDLMRSKEATYRNVDGVNRDKDVIGMVPRLFRLKDIESRHAIEALFGNHNGTTVVRSSDVATKLMEKKAFTKKTLCIPLDGKDEDSSPQAIANAKRRMDTARSIVPQGERVDYAVDLVEFAPEHAYAVKYLLGGVMVVDSKATANQVCFHRDINMRVITRDGEHDFKPAGLAASGARATYHTGIDLRSTNQWHEWKAKMDELNPQFKKMEQMVVDAERQAVKFNQMKDRQSTLTDQMEAHKEKFKFSAASTIRGDLDAIQEELPELKTKLKESASEMKELKEKIAQFEERKRNEKAFADKEKSLWKKKLKDLLEEEKKTKGGFEKARTTLAAKRTELASLEQALKDAVEAKLNYDRLEKEKGAERDAAGIAADQAKVDIDRTVAEKDAFVEEMKAADEKINQMRKLIEKNKKDIAQREVKIEEMERERVKFVADAEHWKKEAKSERKNHPWIEDEKEHFGQKGTDYDFTGYSLSGGEKKMADMEKEMKKMNTHINVNTMNMLAPSEERVLALQKKRLQIEKDRAKLMETIEKLDEKKKIELLAAYKSVNKDFNGIFSMLLPGTSAKLEPADGKDPLKGIEIKVAFNDKWKDSLGELSGGQRSLVALSLVLAMLKFRPAPLYILDEVDAALDLSHTQNIGAMIKTHFKESQFIIVSLKEGMFNHANILFRTRFVDGTSQVSRIDNTSSK